MNNISSNNNIPFHIWVKIGIQMNKKSLINLANTNKYYLNLVKIIILIKLRRKIWFHLLNTFRPFKINNIYKFKEDMVNILDYMLENQILLLGYDHLSEYDYSLCISQINKFPKYPQFINNNSPLKKCKINDFTCFENILTNMYKFIIFKHINSYYPYLLFFHNAIKNNLCYL